MSETFASDPLATRTYTYDSTTPNHNKGVGRLASVSDGSVTTSYKYDIYGRVFEETQTIGSQSYVLAYDYIADGRISKVTHPSGRVVQYSHDAHGPVSLIRMRETVSSPLVKVFKQIKHTAMSGSRSAGFGGDYGLWSLASGLFENGHQMTVTRDLDGRVTRLKTGTVMDLTFGFDLNSNITSITDAIDGARNGSFQQVGCIRPQAVMHHNYFRAVHCASLNAPYSWLLYWAI